MTAAGPLTLGQIVSRLGGRVVGDEQLPIRQVGSLEHAGPGQITFLSDSKHGAKLAATRAAAVILAPENEKLTKLPRILAEKPYAYFARVSQLFNATVLQEPGVHPSAVVSAKASLGKGVSIGAGCVVGDGVTIGDDSCLYPRVVIYPHCSLGKRVVLHSGVVIGADGFGIAPEAGRWVKIPQIGGVRIGAHTAIAACTGIAGSADIGRHCIIGGAAMIHGHIRIADHVKVSAGTLISRSLTKPGTYTGIYPFDEHEAWKRSAVQLRRLAKRKKEG